MSDISHRTDTLEQLLREIHRCRQERRDALLTLERVQQELADMQALSHIGTWRRETDSDIPVWSDRTYLIHGLPIGMPLTRARILELIVEEDRSRVRELFDGSIERAEAFRVVFRIRRPDGKIRVLHTDNLISPDPHTGKPVVHGVVHDITDPVVHNLAPEAVGTGFPKNCLVADLHGIILRCNGTMREHLVHSEPGGSIFRIFASGSSHDALEDAMDAVESGNGIQQIRLVPEGSLTGLEETFTLQAWRQDDTLLGFVITPESEETGMVAEDVTGGAFSTGSLTPITGAWEFEVATGEAIWSGGMFEILELDPNQPIPSIAGFRELIHPEDLDLYSTKVQHFYATGEPLSHTFRVISAQGREKRVAAHMEAVSRTGPRSHAFGTLVDISTQLDLGQVAREQEIQVRSLQQSLEKMNARILEANLRLSKAQEEERARIAESLHDHAGGLITSLNLLLEQMAQEGVDPHLETARSVLDDLGNQVRQTTRELRPNVLARFGIEAAIRELSEDMSELADLKLVLHTEPLPQRVDSRTATMLFRIAREAMMNVVRHAGASEMHVTFRPVDAGVELRIEDDGVGFNLETALSKSPIGLELMFDRADSLNGRLNIRPRTGGGTSVELQILKI